MGLAGNAFDTLKELLDKPATDIKLPEGFKDLLIILFFDTYSRIRHTDDQIDLIFTPWTALRFNGNRPLLRTFFYMGTGP